MDKITDPNDPVSFEELSDASPLGVIALFNLLERKGLVSKAELLAELRRLHEKANSLPGKKCPFCAGVTERSASVCPHCGRDFPSLRPDPDPYVVRD